MISPYAEGFFSVFRPQPRLKVSQWAERNRILPRAGAAEPGAWRNARTPYMVEIMDELSVTTKVKEVVLCKGSQLGATEGGLNWLMYLVDHVGGPILALQPTDENASDWSKQRVAPSLNLCERTRAKFRPQKSRSSGNTILKKEFDGGYLFLSGTNTPNALASLPIGNLYCDEVDRYPLDVGNEGDPIDLALQRLSTYPRAKCFISSTPTRLATSRIWRMYQNSDQRVYEVPCPHCGHYQTLTIENLKWEKGHPEEAEFVCIGCGSFIPERHKTEMLAMGKWRATNPGHWRAGFHISSLYSPIGWLSWAQIARKYEEAEGDVNKMMVFYNTILGLPWEEDTESIAADYLARRAEPYNAMVPMGVLALTCQADVQKNRLECEIKGWGEGEESWGIEFRVIPGDPTVLESSDPDKPTVWQLLDEFRRRELQHEDGGVMKVSCTLVDSGGHCTDTVYQYTKKRVRERVFSVKGGSMAHRPLLNKPTRVGKHNDTWLYVLGVNKGKDLVFGRLKKDTPGPGYCHFPNDENRGYDGEYYAGLISEKKKEVRRNGQRLTIWDLPSGARNEPFDMFVYATAAIRIVNPDWKKLKANRAVLTGSAKYPAPPTVAKRQPAPTSRATNAGRFQSGIDLVQY